MDSFTCMQHRTGRSSSVGCSLTVHGCELCELTLPACNDGNGAMNASDTSVLAT